MGSGLVPSVHFPSGRELLASYWGFLRDGGLVLTEAQVSLSEPPFATLQEGDSLGLEVHIRTLKQTFEVFGRVVRRGADRLFVAFTPDHGNDAIDAKERMLNAAWADTHDVPQRKHRRLEGPGQVDFTVDGIDAHGELLDLSPGGARLRGPARLPVGARVQLRLADETVEGQVRWSTRANEMGVEFSQPTVAVYRMSPRIIESDK